MAVQQVIEYNFAIQQAKETEIKNIEISKKREVEKAQYLQDFFENDFEMLDSRDINFFAEMTGKSANELRRLHPQTKTMEMYVNSFIDDEMDDIFSFF